MSTRRAVGRNVVWNTTGVAVEAAAGFLVAPFLILHLGDTTYGVWIVLGALTSYFGLLDLGIRASVGRYVAFHQAAGDQTAVNRTLSGAVAVLAGLGVLGMTIVISCESMIIWNFDIPIEHKSDVSIALRLVAVNFAISLLANVFDATLWGFQRFDWLNAIDIPVSVTRAGLTFALIGTGGELATLASITLGATLVGGAVKAVLSFRVCPRLQIGPSHLTRSALRELLGFGGWNLLTTIARISRTQFSPLVIAASLGLALVTPFSVACRLLNYVGLALGAATGVLTPLATNLHATDQRDRQTQLFIVGGRYAATLAVFLITFLLVLGEPLIALWIGPAAVAAYPLLVVLAFGELLPATQYVSNGVILAAARHRALAGFGLGETVAVVALTFLLMPGFGLLGAALALALPAVIARGICPMVQGCRLAGVSVGTYSRRALLPALLGALPAVVAVGVSVRLNPPQGWGLFIAYAGMFSVLFGACSACLLFPARTISIVSSLISRAGIGRTPRILPSPDEPGRKFTPGGESFPVTAHPTDSEKRG